MVRFRTLYNSNVLPYICSCHSYSKIETRAIAGNFLFIWKTYVTPLIHAKYFPSGLNNIVLHDLPDIGGKSSKLPKLGGPNLTDMPFELRTA